MKTTSLEKLRDVHGVILVQQMYSKEICRALDSLDQQIRNIQKHLMDKKMELELEISRLPEQNSKPAFFKTGNGIGQLADDPATDRRNLVAWIYKDQLMVKILSLKKHVNLYDQVLAQHEHFKALWKSIWEMIDQLHQNDELMALLAGNEDGLFTASIEKTELHILLRGMNKVKEQLCNANKAWSASVKKDLDHLGLVEWPGLIGNADAARS